MKFLTMFVIVTTSLGIFISCDKDDEPQIVLVEGVTITPNKLEKTLGDAPVILVATVTPANATDQEVTWKSVNPKVAKVDAKGEVRFLSAGKTTITATSKDGNKTAKCEVIVKAKEIAVTGVTLNKKTVTKQKGQIEQLEATILPENASNKKVAWKSSDVKVATVDENGVVKALAIGEAKITVTTEDGNKTAVCTITVTPKLFTLPILDINARYDDIVAYETAKEGRERINTDKKYSPEYKLTNDELFSKIVYYSTWREKDEEVSSYIGASLVLKEGVTTRQQEKYEKFLESKGFERDNAVNWKQWRNKEKHIKAIYFEDSKEYYFIVLLSALPSAEKIDQAITPDELKTWESSNGGTTKSTKSPYWFNVDKKTAKESLFARLYFFNEDNTKIRGIRYYYTKTNLLIFYNKKEDKGELFFDFEKLAIESGFERTPDKDTVIDWGKDDDKYKGDIEDRYYFKNPTTNVVMYVTYYRKYKTVSITYLKASKKVAVKKGDKFKHGQLYYEVISVNPKEVKVTSQKGKYGYPNWEDSEKPKGDIVIDENVAYKGENYLVVSVEESAFSNCSGITSVVFPNTVKVLEKSIFYDCSSLEQVTLPNSLVEIGKSVFYKCANLKTVNIPKSVEKIGNGAFRMCSKMTTFTVDNENANFSSDANGILFNKDKTELVRCPEGSSVTDYIVPNTVTSIGKGAFFGCANLKNVSIPNSVAMVETYAFKKCKKLLSVSLPDGLKAIAYATFEECVKLKEVTMPTNLETIGGNAFNKCGDLTAIVLPKTVTELGYMAFSYCTGLTSIVSHIEKPEETKMNAGVFNEVNKTKCVLTVPKGTKTKYESAEQWKDFSTIKEKN